MQIVRQNLEFIRFLLVGSTAAGINFFSFFICYTLCQMNYKIAVSFAFIITALAHFFMNQKFTFQSKHNDFTTRVLKYILMLLLNYCMSLLIVWCFVHIVGVSPYFGLIGAMGVNAISNYLIMKHFVFVQAKRFISGSHSTKW